MNIPSLEDKQILIGGQILKQILIGISKSSLEDKKILVGGESNGHCRTNKYSLKQKEILTGGQQIVTRG